MKNEHLKPCPFCGGEVGLMGNNGFFNQKEGVDVRSEWFAHCFNCGFETIIWFESKDLIKYWNTRPREEELEKEIERLKDILEWKKALADTADELLQDNRELKKENEVLKKRAGELKNTAKKMIEMYRSEKFGEKIDLARSYEWEMVLKILQDKEK